MAHTDADGAVHPIWRSVATAVAAGCLGNERPTQYIAIVSEAKTSRPSRAVSA